MGTGESTDAIKDDQDAGNILAFYLLKENAQGTVALHHTLRVHRRRSDRSTSSPIHSQLSDQTKMRFAAHTVPREEPAAELTPIVTST
jgi:hypothetical protein